MRRIENMLSRTEQAYAMIRDSISDCTLEPGKHLVQEELAAMLGVSRQPVQQAMLLLKSEGLVVELGARGLHVAPLSPEAMAHRYEIRTVLDQLAARLVAERCAGSAEFAERLLADGEKILVAGEKAQERGAQAEAVTHDVAFHSFLYERSGNPLIVSTSEAHWFFLRRVMNAVLKKAGRGELVWREHRGIIEALARGEVERGCELAAAHVHGAQAALLATLRENGANRSGEPTARRRPPSGHADESVAAVQG